MPQKQHAFATYAGPNETGRVFHALTPRQAGARSGDGGGSLFRR